MPLPFILGGAALIAGLAGAKKGIDGIIDSNKADEIMDEAKYILENAKNRMEIAKTNTKNSIENLGKEKIKASAKELKDFVRIYKKLKNVNLLETNMIDELNGTKEVSEKTLSVMREISLNAADILGSGIAGIGAGVLLGWGTYGGVMALGTASTGTAIAGLSGVAATNATLAWLGGGAIAAGGGGIALGTAVLGGIIAGPALLIAGGLFSSKAKEKLDNAYSNKAKATHIASDIEIAVAKLDHINKTTHQITDLLIKVRKYSDILNTRMSTIVFIKTEWSEFTQEEKNIVAGAVKMVQLLKKILNTPLLTNEGSLTEDAKLLAQQDLW
ncbi:hypothetical protein [Fusobacterium sp.]|uniref:hypothetical protein n=1 Tax=Fusobacterium sp. TaxID=68766 RepID=UPI00396CF386